MNRRQRRRAAGDRRRINPGFHFAHGLVSLSRILGRQCFGGFDQQARADELPKQTFRRVLEGLLRNPIRQRQPALARGRVNRQPSTRGRRAAGFLRDSRLGPDRIKLIAYPPAMRLIGILGQHQRIGKPAGRIGHRQQACDHPKVAAGDVVGIEKMLQPLLDDQARVIHGNGQQPADHVYRRTRPRQVSVGGQHGCQCADDCLIVALATAQGPLRCDPQFPVVIGALIE